MASSATLASAAVLAAEGEPNPLMPHLSELIVGLVAFTLLFLFLRAKVFPMFEKAYAERRAAIEGGVERAQRAEAEAKEMQERYRAQLAEARNEAARIRAEAQSERKSIVEGARAEAQEAAAQVQQRTEAHLHAEVGQARAQLSREVGALAVTLAERILGEELSDRARARASVDRFLDDLERTSASETPRTPTGQS